MEILSRPVLPADHRIPYGADPSQFGDLWLPGHKHNGRPAPVIVFFHGGWWKAEYDLGYAGELCNAFRHEGFACWSVEYRRVGDIGGGWPGTFQDAAAGFDYLSVLAKTYPLDLTRVLTMGHSAGGHLAFWTAGRHHIERGSEAQHAAPQIPLRGTVALAGAVDLRLTIELAGHGTFAHDRGEVFRLMGSSPAAFPERYRAGNPGDLLPFQAPQVLIQGMQDDQIPPDLPSRWASLSHRVGSTATVTMLSGADHFDVVDPASLAWPVVLGHVQDLLRS